MRVAQPLQNPQPPVLHPPNLLLVEKHPQFALRVLLEIRLDVPQQLRDAALGIVTPRIREEQIVTRTCPSLATGRRFEKPNIPGPPGPASIFGFADQERRKLRLRIGRRLMAIKELEPRKQPIVPRRDTGKAAVRFRGRWAALFDCAVIAPHDQGAGKREAGLQRLKGAGVQDFLSSSIPQFQLQKPP